MSWPSQSQPQQGYQPSAAAMPSRPADGGHDRHMINAIDYDQPIRVRERAEDTPGKRCSWVEATTACNLHRA